MQRPRGGAQWDKRSLDWIEPASWKHEHNVLHHGHTGEVDDPDLAEENVDWFRRSKMPLPAKYAVIAFFACTWKLTYYAPNTYQALRWARSGRPRALRDFIDRSAAFDLRTPIGRRFWATSILPYGLIRFAAVPLLFAGLGWWAVLSVFVNSVLAEIFANIHSFLIIIPNHAGEDLVRFHGRAEDKETYCYRQVVGSTNYSTGKDWLDFLQGGLNYQIEHHLFPDLPLLKYRQYQPRIKALGEKHGLRYTQESIFLRVSKLIDIIMNRGSMIRDREGDPVTLPSGTTPSQPVAGCVPPTMQAQSSG